jgi:hypothetical protein
MQRGDALVLPARYCTCASDFSVHKPFQTLATLFPLLKVLEPLRGIALTAHTNGLNRPAFESEGDLKTKRGFWCFFPRCVFHAPSTTRGILTKGSARLESTSIETQMYVLLVAADDMTQLSQTSLSRGEQNCKMRASSPD